MEPKTLISFNNSIEEIILSNLLQKEKINICKINKVLNKEFIVNIENLKIHFSETDNKEFQEEILDDIFSSDEEIEEEEITINISSNKSVKEFTPKNNFKIDDKNILNFEIINFKEEKIKKNLNECIFCLKELKKNDKIIVINKCNHYYHFECSYIWLLEKINSKLCPICR